MYLPYSLSQLLLKPKLKPEQQDFLLSDRNDNELFFISNINIQGFRRENCWR